MCDKLETLKYLEEFIENSHALRKVISPLPYTSYHMTTYVIYSNHKKPLKFIQDWLKADSTHKSSHEKCIPTEDVYPIMYRAQQIWNDAGKEQFTVKSDRLTIPTMSKPALLIYVSITDETLMEKFTNAREQSDEVFEKKSTFPPLHISLGYLYSKIENLTQEDQGKFAEEWNQLQKLVPETFTLHPPAVSSFSSMKKFIPIVSE